MLPSSSFRDQSGSSILHRLEFLQVGIDPLIASIPVLAWNVTCLSTYIMFDFLYQYIVIYRYIACYIQLRKKSGCFLSGIYAMAISSWRLIHQRAPRCMADPAFGSTCSYNRLQGNSNPRKRRHSLKTKPRINLSCRTHTWKMASRKSETHQVEQRTYQSQRSRPIRCTVVRPIQKLIGKWKIRPPVKS